jgi:hypothetical protein
MLSIPARFHLSLLDRANEISGSFDGLEAMVTSRISIDDVEAKGFKKLIENPESEVKILVTTKKSLLGVA